VVKVLAPVSGDDGIYFEAVFGHSPKQSTERISLFLHQARDAAQVIAIASAFRVTGPSVELLRALAARVVTLPSLLRQAQLLKSLAPRRDVNAQTTLAPTVAAQTLAAHFVGEVWFQILGHTIYLRQDAELHRINYAAAFAVRLFGMN